MTTARHGRANARTPDGRARRRHGRAARPRIARGGTAREIGQ
ncbi:hypothetical protein C7S16_6501 [Burkholderia thailandensis]|uniref:Uncharacterized protein n=1 Tax=Burkholderia thailandensis TaxID=57975 RepID=A0AAW9CXV9_BURTH|nr:hypothetical protein [Burkholderia thailandensis]